MASLFFPVVLASPPTVFCIDCDDKKTSEITTNGIDKWQTFYAKEGSRIVLQGSAGLWQGDDGQKISDGSSLTFVAKDDAQYILKAASGDFYATISIVSLSSCVPEWRSILIDGDEYNKDNTKIVAAGEELDFEARVKGDCKNYQVGWSVNLPSAVAFNNPHSLSTKGYVAKDYSGKNPVVTVAIISENGERQREQTINLAVRKNSAPAIEIRNGPTASYKSFEVSFAGSTTGTFGDEDGDYIACIEAWLKDASGELVSHDRKTMDREKPLPVLTLKPESMGPYNLTARITDKYGESAEKTMTILVAEKGNSGRDKPIIDMPSDTYCVFGESCDISVYSADENDENVFIDHFYRGKKMVKPFKLPPGDHRVKVEAFEVDEDGRRKNSVAKTVQVHVVANATAITEPENVLIAPEELTDPKMPLGIIPLVAGLFAGALFARRRLPSIER